MTSYEVLASPRGRRAADGCACATSPSRPSSRAAASRGWSTVSSATSLLERCSCEHDARGAYACLTERGRERLAEARVHAPGGRARALLLALLRARAERCWRTCGSASRRAATAPTPAAERSLLSARARARGVRRRSPAHGSLAGGSGVSTRARLARDSAHRRRWRDEPGTRSPTATSTATSP